MKFPVKAYFTGQVESPTSVYNGQKLTKLVRRKTPPKTPTMMASKPDITFVAISNTIATATTIRTKRSTLPMFFFMLTMFRLSTDRFQSPAQYISGKWPSASNLYFSQDKIPF
jgi:hypothetical protein